MYGTKEYAVMQQAYVPLPVESKFGPSKSEVFLQVLFSLIAGGLLAWSWLRDGWLWPWSMAPSIGLVAGGALSIILCLNRQLILSGDHLIYRTGMRKTHTIRYRDIEQHKLEWSIWSKQLIIVSDDRAHHIHFRGLERPKEIHDVILRYMERDK